MQGVSCQLLCLKACLNHLAYIVTCLWLPKLDVLGMQADDVTMRVDDTSSGTACTHIDADIVRDMRTELVARIKRVHVAVWKRERFSGQSN